MFWAIDIALFFYRITINCAINLLDCAVDCYWYLSFMRMCSIVISNTSRCSAVKKLITGGSITAVTWWRQGLAILKKVRGRESPHFSPVYYLAASSSLLYFSTLFLCVITTLLRKVIMNLCTRMPCALCLLRHCAINEREYFISIPYYDNAIAFQRDLTNNGSFIPFFCACNLEQSFI